MSTHKAQEVQKSSSTITDSEHVVRKSPQSSTLDSVPVSPADICSSSGDINNSNNNMFVTSSSNTAVNSSNMNSVIPVLGHNNGSPARTFLMNGSLQPESAPCNKTLAVVNGPISLLKDKQACASSLTNPLQQNGEFRSNSNDSNSNSNHHNNNNSNVKEDANAVSAQCQKICAGFGGTIIQHGNNNNNNNNNNSNNNNVNSNNSNNNNNNINSAGNKCVGGITNQIVTTKVVKPG
jgi:hypothetical protein